LKVFVYPNPYRIDGGYSEHAYEEQPDTDNSEDRQRRIHFTNLPPKCTIKIYTIDGDLVRDIFHDVPASDPTSSHESWNGITRNTQQVVSGLYYWSVEDEDGNIQLGKLVIIL